MAQEKNEELEKEEEIVASSPPILDDIVPLEAKPEEKAEAPKEEEKPEEKVEAKSEEKVEEAPPTIDELRAALQATQTELAEVKKKLPVQEERVQETKDVFTEEFNTTLPSEAIKRELDRREAKRRADEQFAYTQAVLKEAMLGKVKGWEDFPDLSKDMPALVERYGPIVNPAMENTPLTLEALALIARGYRATQGAVNKEEKEVKKDFAKEAAFMEGGQSSAHDSPVDEDLSNLPPGEIVERLKKAIPLHQR